MPHTQAEIRKRLDEQGQGHLARFWGRLDEAQRSALVAQIDTIDFALMNRLVAEWVHQEPPAERFKDITPVPAIPKAESGRPDVKEAQAAGEEALRAGRVGLLLVAGGQGTRLGFDGPKGAYPIGPVSKRSLFEFHAEKIRNLQRRYACTLPWYIMVSETNETATRAFFRDHAFFGLGEENVTFFKQRMVPCVDDSGKFMLDAPAHIAMNPNGHGGSIPAVVENGIAKDAHNRGIDTLSYFQVDNWAVKVADPVFIGHHVQRNAEMSSKVHQKNKPRESVGVHCICDGEYRTIEYSELDIYPQLLETDADGSLRYFAGNPAIHILSVGFIERMYANYDTFPWHRAHKRIPHLDDSGNLVKPEEPNGYKFETFIFDALRFVNHEPVALVIGRAGEYTPIKQFDGTNSVQAAWASNGRLWADWLEAAGRPVPRDADGTPTIAIEISPEFALTKEEFLKKAAELALAAEGDVAIGPDGELLDQE